MKSGEGDRPGTARGALRGGKAVRAWLELVLAKQVEPAPTSGGAPPSRPTLTVKGEETS
jgi:hypothetical protein